MNDQFAGKVIALTGAASGIGTSPQYIIQGIGSDSHHQVWQQQSYWRSEVLSSLLPISPRAASIASAQRSNQSSKRRFSFSKQMFVDTKISMPGYQEL